MICKHILLITLLNRPELILMHTIKWFQVFLTQIILFTINYLFDCYLTSIILFNINPLIVEGEVVTRIAIQR